MSVPFLKSLSVRLAGGLLLLSGTILLLMTEIHRRGVERLLREEAEMQAVMATNGVVAGLDGVIGSGERLTRFVAREIEGRVLTPTEIERTARNVVVDNPNIYGFSIAYESGSFGPSIERRGMYVYRSTTLSRFTARDLATPDQPYWNQDWYREAVEKGRTVWSEPTFDRGGADRNVVRVSTPFFRAADDERPAGVVAAVIELDWLRRLANLNEFSDTSQVIVFSRTGRLILHPKPAYTIAETMETLADKTQTPELAAIRQSVVARRQGSVSYTDQATGRQLHANYKPAQVAGWGVVVVYDEAELLKNRQAFRGIAVLFLGLTLLLLGGVVIGVTHYALRPLGALTKATAEIAGGNLDCVIAVPARTDEIGTLARAFRTMRDALKAQHLERRWAGHSIEHQLKYNQLIIDSIGELVFVLTKALNISRINPAVSHALGHTSAELVKLPLERLVHLEDEITANGSGRLAAALSVGRPLRDLPATALAKDGTSIPVYLTMVPLIDANRIVGGVVTLRIKATDAERTE